MTSTWPMVEMMISWILDIFKKVELTEIANGLVVGVERAASRMTKFLSCRFIYSPNIS